MALVERVRALAARGAREALDALAVAVPSANHEHRAPRLPGASADNEEADRRQSRADQFPSFCHVSRGPRDCGGGARLVGGSVGSDRERVFRAAAEALGRQDIDAFLSVMGRSVGPPWQAKHKLAAAAALAATSAPRTAPRNRDLEQLIHQTLIVVSRETSRNHGREQGSTGSAWQHFSSETRAPPVPASWSNTTRDMQWIPGV